MKGRTSARAFLGAAWLLTSCREVPAPEGDVLSVSRVLLPSPGLVVGDTMRDSLGVAAPLRVIAYRADGQPADPQPTATFVSLDTGAHLATGSAFLIGDDAGTSVRLVGTVAGLRTQTEIAVVTQRPDTLVAADSTRHTKRFSLLTDEIAINSAELNVIVQHRNGTAVTGVDAVIVRYAIVRALPAVPDKGPTIVLVSGSVPSSRDTTSGGGRAARVAQLRNFTFSSALPDSAIVNATASHRGVSLGFVRFTIVFMHQ